MPVSPASFSAADPDGAAPITGMPASPNTRATAYVAAVFPAPARPTTQSTRSGVGHTAGRRAHGRGHPPLLGVERHAAAARSEYALDSIEIHHRRVGSAPALGD